jgi:hypothetical protein
VWLPADWHRSVLVANTSTQAASTASTAGRYALLTVVVVPLLIALIGVAGNYVLSRRPERPGGSKARRQGGVTTSAQLDEITDRVGRLEDRLSTVESMLSQVRQDIGALNEAKAYTVEFRAALREWQSNVDTFMRSHQ